MDTARSQRDILPVSPLTASLCLHAEGLYNETLCFMVPQARALHFLIVPFSTTVPSIPTAGCQLEHGRGHPVMLQRTQLFGLVKAILLDDLRADKSKQMGRVGTAVSTHRQASTQLFVPCGRGACRTLHA